MSGRRSDASIARSMLFVLAPLLVAGITISLVMGQRATNDSKAIAIAQARDIVTRSLPLVLSTQDVSAPVTAIHAEQITQAITPVVLDPSPFDEVTIWSADATIVYSTDSSKIGQSPEEERATVRAVVGGGVSSTDKNGVFTVLAPLRLRADGLTVVAELSRPDDTIAAAGRPWRYNATFLAAAFLVVCIMLWRALRTSGRELNPQWPPQQVAPSRTQSPGPRPIEAPTPGLREEAEARRRAEDRAKAAEERLAVLQDQYRTTLDELQNTQRTLRQTPMTTLAPDPANEERAVHAEGRVRLLEGQLQAMNIERDKLAKLLAEAVKERRETTAAPDPRARQMEQETIGLRAELEGAQTELSITRRELDAIKAQASRTNEVQEDLDAAQVEVLHTREALESARIEIDQQRLELDDARNEVRALRAEEQRAAELEDQLRAVRAERDSLAASHEADLIEREADLEEKVRRNREEFQRELDEIQADLRGQMAQREAELTAQMARREAELTAEMTLRENELITKLNQREVELTGKLAEREAELTGTIADREKELKTQLTQSRGELHARIETAEHEAKVAARELGAARADLQSLRDEIGGARQELSARNDQLGKTNAELLRSKTEIETLQRELTSSQRDLQNTTAELASANAELQSASADVQMELGRGVELSQRAEMAEAELRSARERAERAEADLAHASARAEELSAQMAAAEAHHALEMAEREARPDLEEILQANQERLASQAEKLVEVEERARSTEQQLAEALIRLEDAESEARQLQMEKALHDLQAPPEPVAVPAAAVELSDEGPYEDRRMSSPFVKELSLDAKKSLSHILGLTNVMKYKKDGKEQAQLIKQLTAAARRLDHTVSDLADADHLARGTIELTIRRTDLEALVKRVVEESGVGADHDVRLETEPLKVAVDQLRTEQILAGLLRSSGERTSTGKGITVRLAHTEGGAMLSVEDPEPSSDGSVSPVVQRFAEVQGGWIRVESRESGGSAFRVFLPDAAGRPGHEGPEAATPRDQLHIMVSGTPEEEPWDAVTSEQLLVQELHRLSAED